MAEAARMMTPAERNQFRYAVELFRAYHGYAPTTGGRDIKVIGFNDEAVVYIGECVGIIYKTMEHKRAWIHRFASKKRPLLYVSNDGRQAYLLKGAYRFTSRGFIG